MAITEPFTGTATINTEQSLTTNTAGPDVETSDGIFQCFIDLNAMLAADVFEFAVYEKVLTSSTQRKVYTARFSGLQTPPNWVSPSLILINGWDFTLIKISGTNRSIDWSIRKVA